MLNHLEQSDQASRLDAALAALPVTFRGMTARPDETNCECHWGSAEELALLKVPGIELDADLLRRTWSAPDWRDHASVLPQLAAVLVSGRVEPWIGLDEIGKSFARGAWQHWSSEQTRAVQEFLEAWWTYTLTELPWDNTLESDDHEQAVLADLAAWLAHVAPARLRHGCPAELLHQVRLLGISTPARWDDRYWPAGRPV